MKMKNTKDKLMLVIRRLDSQIILQIALQLRNYTIFHSHVLRRGG